MGLASFNTFGGGGSGTTDFILEDGTINPNSLDGTGNVRVASAYPNSIAFNSMDPDRDNATFPRQLVFDHTVEDIIIAGKGSGYQMDLGATSLNSTIYLDDTYSEIRASSYLGTTFSWLYSYEQGGGFTTTGILNKNNPTSGNPLETQLIMRSNSYEAFLRTQDNQTLNGGGAWTTTNRITPPTSINSQNTTINADIINAVALGMDGGTVDKSGWAFAQNIEVQGGELLVTAGDIEMETIGKGVILSSPDATRWRITIDNTGTLITTSI